MPIMNVDARAWLTAKISDLKYTTAMGKQMWGERYEHDDLQPLLTLEARILDLEATLSRLSGACESLQTALESIANNSCCAPCREAGLVAKVALNASEITTAVGPRSASGQ